MSDSSLSTQERVIKAMGEVITNGEVQIDSTLEELGVDSLMAIEILFEVEEEFDIDISGDANKMNRIKSVRDVVDGVERLLAGEDMGFWGEEEDAPEAETDSASGVAPTADKASEPDKAPRAEAKPDAAPDKTPGETHST